jgi:Zn-finger nucleic acid-binding protein
MRCPNCNVDLVITDRMGIEIDYCPRCRGVWLDRGELDKVIDRAVASFSRPGAPEDRYDDDRRSGYERPREPERPREDDRSRDDRDRDESWKKRRKKSFLGELFDFD